MISTYRRVLGLPGALAFSLSGLVARLPISMVSLGIVLLVSARTGSYTLAGSVSASYLIANAVFAVLQARIVDRRGQSRVLPWTISAFGAGLVLMTVAVEAGAPAPVPHLCAALAGAALPQIGSCVRARWSYVVQEKPMLQTAFAIEAVVDESVFMIGPTLVTLLATVVAPWAGLAAAVLTGVAGTAALVSQRRTEPPVGLLPTGHGPGAMGWHVLGPLTVSAFAMGILFGGSEVATVAFSQELGHKAYSGPLLAIWALGSLLSGLVVGALHITASNGTRYRWGLLSLGLLMTPLPFVHGFVLMGTFLLLAGFAISPTLIAAVAWVEESVPAGRLTEGIAIITTGLAAGVAPGAAVVGVVIDRAGASASFWVPAAAGLSGAAVAFGTLLVSGARAGHPDIGEKG
ncbi:MAG: MFS transporter [Nocardioidaceae bacterium]